MKIDPEMTCMTRIENKSWFYMKYTRKYFSVERRPITVHFR